MRYGTLCSGIESARLAFPAHWELAWCSEIDEFCREIISHHNKDVINYGDITEQKTYPSIDLIVSGTPCQSFSAQGHRRGLDDPRGKLAFSFCEILRSVRPRWIIWENVANVLRVEDGRAFREILTRMAELRYGIAYRVLDAQYFGVPQRRRRVFIVGHYGDWRRAAAVLFDGRSNQELKAAAEEIQQRRMRTVRDAGTVLGWSGDETPKFGIGISPTLRASQGGEGNGFVTSGEVAGQFTITELERLQGIPDGYTDVGQSGKSKRKHAIGNAFCVPVIRWIGQRINALEQLVD